jgi:ribosomal protein S2
LAWLVVVYAPNGFGNAVNANPFRIAVTVVATNVALPIPANDDIPELVTLIVALLKIANQYLPTGNTTGLPRVTLLEPLEVMLMLDADATKLLGSPSELLS